MDDFTIRVSCSNCCTEYDMTFPRGTKFDQYGFGGESYLVDATGRGVGSYAKPVACTQCGVNAVSRIHRLSPTDSRKDD